MEKKMRAAAIVGERKVEVVNVRKPEPEKGQIRLKIKACALCTWEQRVFTRVSKMPLPFIGGHEYSGIIDAIGEDVDESEYPLGQKITVRGLDACGKCYYCRRGKQNLCTEIGKARKDPSKEIYGPGGLGEYLVVNIESVYKMDDDVDFLNAALTEPVACVINSLEQANIELADDVIVIGAGIMGMLHVMLSKMRGARVIVSEPDEKRRNFALSLGADIAFNPIEEDPVEKVKSLTEGRGADVVFNTTAIAAVAETAVNMLGKTGRVVMYSSIHPDKPINVSPQWLHNSQAIVTGAVSPSIKSFEIASKLISKKVLPVEKVISEVYDLDDVQKAFESALKLDTYRVLVKL